MRATRIPLAHGRPGGRHSSARGHRIGGPRTLARLLPPLVRLMALALSAAVAVSACAPGAAVTTAPTFPVSAETLPPATDSVPSGFGPAVWALDPAYPMPGPASTTLHVLVWELACSSGRPTTGRMSAPAVTSTATTVTITIGVRRFSGFLTCPGVPGTPAILTLPQSLGERALLDGGRTPVSPPSPEFIPMTPSP